MIFNKFSSFTKYALCFELEHLELDEFQIILNFQQFKKEMFRHFQYNLKYFEVFKVFLICPKIIAMRKLESFETT